MSFPLAPLIVTVDVIIKLPPLAPPTERVRMVTHEPSRGIVVSLAFTAAESRATGLVIHASSLPLRSAIGILLAVGVAVMFVAATPVLDTVAGVLHVNAAPAVPLVATDMVS